MFNVKYDTSSASSTVCPGSFLVCFAHGHGADNDIDDDLLLCMLLPSADSGGQIVLLYILTLVHGRLMAEDPDQEAMTYQIGHDVRPHQEKQERFLFFIDDASRIMSQDL